MDKQPSKRVLLVGATGYAGEQLARYLLQETDATVILAGRSEAKLKNLHTGLLQHHPADRLETLAFDAAKFESNTLVDFDLLVNATNEGPHNGSLIQACLDHQADWIDMQMTNELVKAPPVLRESIEQAGRSFVIQAGFHPGMVAPLVRYADQQVDAMDSAIVGSVIRDETGMPFTSAYTELMAAMRDFKGEIYIDGQWEKLGYAGYPRVEFEYGFGKQVTYPMDLDELRQVTESMPNLEKTGFFVAGFNWFADYFVTPLIMLSSRVAPRRTAAPLARLLSWSTRKFSRSPYGTVLQVDATGQRDGRSANFRLSLFHDDMYVMTTVPTVAMIKQMLNGQVTPGIHLMGLCCDPVQLLEDIGRTDVSVTQQTFYHE